MNFFKAALVPKLLVLVTVLNPIIAVPIPHPIASVPRYYYDSYDYPYDLYKHAGPQFGSTTSSLPPFPSISTSTPHATVATPFPTGTASFPPGTPIFPTGARPHATGPVPYPTGRA